ncbi:MAG: hypothetical protein U5S82_07975 [Gammaproteobacteria bacterium]|nr:hypothetical protein [Gammaproteobacteria bacterium]
MIMLAMVLVGLELGLRVLGFSYYWALSRFPDPYRGFAPMAGAEARQSQEGEAWVSINGHGFRDREWTAPQGDTHRITILGDSMTEAVQVAVEATWWRRLEGRLNACGYRDGPVQLMNFAVSGYSTAQALETLRHHVPQHRPAEVWLAFFPGNDVAENHPGLNGDPIRPYLRPAAEGWAMDYGFRGHPRYRRKTGVLGRWYYAYLLRLRLSQAVVMVYHGLSLGPRLQGMEREWYWEPGIDARVYAPPRDEPWTEAWEATRELLRRTAETAEALDASYRVVALTTAAQVAPDADRAQAMAARLGVPDLFYSNWLVGRFAAEDGYAYTDLAPALADHARATGEQLHGFGATRGAGHWNATGHAAAARKLADRLCPPPNDR